MHLILRRADVIFTVSNFTRERILNTFPKADPQKIRVIGNGVVPPDDSVRFHDASCIDAMGVKKGQFLLAVGGLTLRKGGDRLLRLGSLMLERKSPIKLVVCGRGHDDALLAEHQSLVASHPEFPVLLPGFVPDAEVEELRRSAIALLFLSRYEGFGIPPVEAMASALPVICTRAAAIPEIVGDAGLYVSGDSAEEIWGHVIALTNSIGMRAELNQRGKKRVQQFDWELSGARVVEALQDLR